MLRSGHGFASRIDTYFCKMLYLICFCLKKGPWGHRAEKGVKACFPAWIKAITPSGRSSLGLFWTVLGGFPMVTPEADDPARRPPLSREDGVCVLLPGQGVDG